jgi:tetratricopeptide (TPR) repeat protein
LVTDIPLSNQDRGRWAALLVAACIVVYANGVRGTFTYDDKAIIRDNPRIRTSHGVSEIFQTQYFGGPRGSGSAYRPVLLLSYAVQWWMRGGDAAAFHVANIAFHAMGVLLFAGLLLRLGLPPPASLGAALLFAVHPIHVEAVTSLVGRGETQTTVFVLLYLLLAERSFGEGRGRVFFIVAAIVVYGLAVLTKESGAIAPAIAGLLLFFRPEGTFGSRLQTVLRRGWPLFIGSALVLAGIFVLRSWVLGGPLRSPGSGIFEVENALAPVRPVTRIANASLILWRYVGRCLFPLHLSADESAWSIRVWSARSPLPLAAAVLLASAGLLVLWRSRRRDPVALGFLFFGLTFLPTGNFLFPIGTIFAERIAYLPSAGLCLALGVLLMGRSAALESVSRRRMVALTAVALAFACRTIVRNAVWWSDEALFANSLSTAPKSAKAEYNFAYISSEKRRWATARLHYTRAVEIYGGYWDAWAGKGRVEKELGMLVEAERSYRKSIEVSAAYENGYFGLGQVRETGGRMKEALEAYRDGLEHIPKSLPLAYHLALLSGRLGLSRAPADWKRALALGESSADVRTEYARWLWRRGEDREAVRQAREVLRKDPSYLPAIRLLGERGTREHLMLAQALALEEAFRLSRSSEDFAELERIAQRNPSYGRRWAALKLPAPTPGIRKP